MCKTLRKTRGPSSNMTLNVTALSATLAAITKIDRAFSGSGERPGTNASTIIA